MAILSVIIFVFCIVVYKKKAYFISNKEKVELGSDINMTSNPSYDTVLTDRIKKNASIIIMQQTLKFHNACFKIINRIP